MNGNTIETINNDGHNPKLEIFIQPNIGLESDVRHAIVDLLNVTLADESVLTAKTRSAHWNIRGPDFLELHTLFETQYQLVNNISNEIAERVRMLGGVATGSFQGFLQFTRLEEQAGDIPDVLHLLADHESSIRYLREDIRKCTEEYEDEGTFDMLVKFMRLHEKMAWMLRSYIEYEPIPVKPRKRLVKFARA